MDTRMYVMTHKQYTKPEDDWYISLHVGRAIGQELGYQGDCIGDHISEKNKNYCELTGIYWLWKNVQCDIVGICHYRRYFVREEQFLTKEYVEQVLESADIILPNSGCTQHQSVKEHYAKVHHWKDMQLCRDVLEELYPEYVSAFDLCMDCNLFTLGNMMICRKELFDTYCEWLFEILFEVEKRIDISTYDVFQARVMGYLSERLLRVWVLYNSYKIREEKVIMINPEESENAAKSVELKFKYMKLALKDLLGVYRAGNYMDVTDCSPLSVDFHGKRPVWTCWWQGEEEAPELVKSCLASIRRNVPQDIIEVRLITMDNVGEYITLPGWIIQKFEEGKISLTHLSDILRAGLLYRYGGLWIDATYYVARPLSRAMFTEYEFYTQRMEKSMWRADIVQGRWACNFLYGKAGNVLFRFMLNAFYTYWATQESLIDYFWMDYIIAAAYEAMPEVREMIDRCPYSHPQVLTLQNMLNQKFNQKKWEHLLEETGIFKLSYKIPLQKEIITGEQTFYGYLCDNKIDK